MSTEMSKLKNKALELSADERALLAQHLWDSLGSFISPEIEREWFEAAKNRWQESEEGKV